MKHEKEKRYFIKFNINIYLIYLRIHPCLSTKTRTVSQLQFYSYRLAIRKPTQELYSSIHLSKKLFHQYIVDSYIKIEAGRLNRIRNNQKQLRVESYQGLYDYIHS